MSEETNINLVPNVLNSSVVNKTYDDLLHPALNEVGTALGTVFGILNTLMAPLKRWQLGSNVKTEHFTQDLVMKYSAIPPNKIIEPSLNIIARSLEAIKYDLDEKEIREYFLNLIASTMHADKAPDVHPSFINKILELSTHDAIVFRELYKHGPNLAYCQS